MISHYVEHLDASCQTRPLRFIKHLLCDSSCSHDAPLNHLLGDLASHHAASLCVLRSHHHPICWTDSGT